MDVNDSSESELHAKDPWEPSSALVGDFVLVRFISDKKNTRKRTEFHFFSQTEQVLDSGKCFHGFSQNIIILFPDNRNYTIIFKMEQV